MHSTTAIGMVGRDHCNTLGWGHSPHNLYTCVIMQEDRKPRNRPWQLRSNDLRPEKEQQLPWRQSSQADTQVKLYKGAADTFCVFYLSHCRAHRVLTGACEEASTHQQLHSYNFLAGSNVLVSRQKRTSRKLLIKAMFNSRQVPSRRQDHQTQKHPTNRNRRRNIPSSEWSSP